MGDLKVKMVVMSMIGQLVDLEKWKSKINSQ